MSQTEADKLIAEIIGAKAPRPRLSLEAQADQLVREIQAGMNAPKIPMIRAPLGKILGLVTPQLLHDFEYRFNDIRALLQSEPDRAKAQTVLTALVALRQLITNAPFPRRADYSHLNKSKLKALAIELARVMATPGKMYYSRSQVFYLPNFNALLNDDQRALQNSIRLHNERIRRDPMIRKF